VERRRQGDLSPFMETPVQVVTKGRGGRFGGK
jgi:ribose transport system substrate-binding protein